jgi:hypothetical protein
MKPKGFVGLEAHAFLANQTTWEINRNSHDGTRHSTHL